MYSLEYRYPLMYLCKRCRRSAYSMSLVEPFLAHSCELCKSGREVQNRFTVKDAHSIFHTVKKYTVKKYTQKERLTVKGEHSINTVKKHKTNSQSNLPWHSSIPEGIDTKNQTACASGATLPGISTGELCGTRAIDAASTGRANCWTCASATPEADCTSRLMLAS
jgi:hypothetical protein